MILSRKASLSPQRILGTVTLQIAVLNTVFLRYFNALFPFDYSLFVQSLPAVSLLHGRERGEVVIIPCKCGHSSR